ncbi:MAG: NarK/NasA family nitrate transporter [Alicyclobacillus herbarius]|uniref:MFS transporter n=1 Tax=Alicyclobacillus herbarius TaxID=122960 RepID=UPI0003FCB0A9|nr:nitrate/nitrite transporter [Alicyclobacillus herbarius]MCL6632064.1 NarK/NasA family nitrate transporter [Alicyclobacillus herbarius]
MRKTVLGISMVSMIVSFVVWSLISPIAPELTQVYHLNSFQKSVLVATPVLLGSVLRIPLGMLTDRFGGRRTYSLLMLFLVIPLVGIAHAHSFGLMIFWEIWLGVAGASFAVAVAYVSKWYPPERQGFILGITALGNAGTAAAGFLVPSLYFQLGFAGTSYLLVGAVIVMAMLLWFVTRDAQPAASGVSKGVSTGQPTAQVEVQNMNRRFWSHPDLWLLSFFYFITFGGFVAFGNYLPTLLQSEFSLTPVDAGMRAAGFVILATAVRPVGGWLADSIRPQTLLLVTFTTLLLAAGVLAFSLSSMITTTVAALVIAVMLGLGNGAVFKLVPLYFTGQVGKATGVIGALGGIGGFFPPLVLGALKQATGSYTSGLLLLALASLLALLLVGFCGRKRPQQPTHDLRGRRLRESA